MPEAPVVTHRKPGLSAPSEAVFARFGGPDEEALAGELHLDARTIVEASLRGRSAADELLKAHPGKAPRRIALDLGVALTHGRWRAAGGRIAYFAEAVLKPPCIVLNMETIERIAEALAHAPVLGPWGELPTILEVVTAHELYHIFARAPSDPEAEVAACSFARRLTDMPFSPFFYQRTLRRSCGRIRG